MPFWHHILTWIVAYKFWPYSQSMYHRHVKPPTDGYVILLCGDGKCVTKLHSKGYNTCHPFPCFGKKLDPIKPCHFWHNIFNCIVAYQFVYMSQSMYNRHVKPPADCCVLLLCNDGKCVTKPYSKGCNTCHPFHCFGKLLDSINTCHFDTIFWPKL